LPLPQCLLETTEQAGFILPRKFVFPNPKDTPACSAQACVHQPVAGEIAGELLFPENAVAGGLRAVFGTAVPETTVHKQCRARFAEDKVGTHGELMVFS
jgi:hypothetical protein